MTREIRITYESNNARSALEPITKPLSVLTQLSDVNAFPPRFPALVSESPLRSHSRNLSGLSSLFVQPPSVWTSQVWPLSVSLEPEGGREQKRGGNRWIAVSLALSPARFPCCASLRNYAPFYSPSPKWPRRDTAKGKEA